MSPRNAGVAHHMGCVGIAQSAGNGLCRRCNKHALARYVGLIGGRKQLYIAFCCGDNDAHITAAKVYLNLFGCLFYGQDDEHLKAREGQTHIAHVAFEAFLHGVFVEERRHKALWKSPFTLVGGQLGASLQHGSEVFLARPA